MGGQGKRAAERTEAATTLGKRIAAEMEKRDLSVRAVERASGISRNFLGALIRGDRDTTVTYLGRIAKAIGCSLHDLLPDDPEMVIAEEPPNDAIPEESPAGVIPGEQGSVDNRQTAHIPAQGAGGGAMAGSDPPDAAAAWMRMAGEMLAEIRLQREQVMAPMARANENMSKAQADLASAQRMAVAVASGQDPRTVAGTAPKERREGESGDANQPSADAQQSATVEGGRAAG